jgi:hypothetical protein
MLSRGSDREHGPISHVIVRVCDPLQPTARHEILHSALCCQYCLNIEIQLITEIFCKVK